jgi:signal transduction histidine kinase/putative methionine-R-sulfoxide reductase with GAF domain
MPESMTTERKQAEHFELLLEVGRLLSSKLELSELLHTIMQLAARVVNAETASLLLVDLETNELYFDVALGLDPELSKIRLKMGEGIAGTVAAASKPEIINDVSSDPRWSSKVDEDSGFVTRSILAAPIVLRGKCIGVVEAINRIGGDFTDIDLRIFEAFASQAAVAIENARLFSSLIEEKSKLGKLLNEMHDAAILTDGKGNILVSNEAARGFMTSGGENRIESAIEGMTLTPSLEDVLKSDQPLLAFEAVREEPKKLILAGSASAITEGKSGDVTGRVVVFRDVTEERREEGLKRNFLSLISHKLKTPLASITGYSQLLIDDLRKKEDEKGGFQVNALGTVLQQGQKLTGLVEKLLNYTVLEDLQDAELSRIEFKIGEILAQAVDALKPVLSEKGADTVVTCPPEAKAVGDPALVRDVFKNLIENAVKFFPGDAPKIEIEASIRDGFVEVHVRDNGPGIPPEELDRVFRKFYQIDASFTGQIEGWGLGLPFARVVIEKLGGTVRCESQVDNGCDFIVRLPAAP